MIVHDTGKWCGLCCPCSIHYACDMTMQWHIAFHMHEDIALNGCECLVNESTLRLVFDLVGSVKWDNVQQSHTVN